MLRIKNSPSNLPWCLVI